jgi:hypothetical protein
MGFYLVVIQVLLAYEFKYRDMRVFWSFLDSIFTWHR